MAIKRPDQLTQVTGITNDDIFIVQTDVSNADVTQRAVGYIKKSDIGFLRVEDQIDLSSSLVVYQTGIQTVSGTKDFVDGVKAASAIISAGAIITGDLVSTGRFILNGDIITGQVTTNDIINNYVLSGTVGVASANDLTGNLNIRGIEGISVTTSGSSGILISGTSTGTLVGQEMTGNFVDQSMTGILAVNTGTLVGQEMTGNFVDQGMTGNFVDQSMTGVLAVNTGTLVGQEMTGNFVDQSMTGSLGGGGSVNTGTLVGQEMTGDFVTQSMTGGLGGGGGGSTETASNIGAGTGLISGKVANDIKVKSIIGGGSITVTGYGDGETILISGTGGASINTGTLVGQEMTGDFVTQSMTGGLGGGGGGSTETASNIGAGTGLISGKVANDIKVKSIIGGGSITVTGYGDGETILISGTGGASINTGTLVGQEMTGDFVTQSMTGGLGGGGGGSTETASNIGAGTGLISGKVANDIKVKSIIGGGSITVTGYGDGETILISGTGGASINTGTLVGQEMTGDFVTQSMTGGLGGGGGGSTETASNIGAGTGLISGKVANDIKVKSIIGGGSITVTGYGDGETILISGTGGASINTGTLVGQEMTGDFVTQSMTGGLGGGGGGTSYTAGTGLTLVGSEFNTANTGAFKQLDIEGGVYAGTAFAKTLETGTIKVTVASKTSKHPSYGQGSANSYYLDGHEAPTLLLLSGTYRFDESNSTNNTHQFKFYLDSSKTTPYTTNTSSNGSPGQAGAYSQITISDDAPGALYYQCSNHDYMGGRIELNSYGSFVTTGSTGSFVTQGMTGTLVGQEMTGNFVTQSMTGGLGGGGGGGGGSTETASNIGAGTGLISGKVANDIKVKSLTGNGNITVVDYGDGETISISGSTGSLVGQGMTGNFVTQSMTGILAVNTGTLVGQEMTGNFVDQSMTGGLGGGGGGSTETASNIGVGTGLISGKVANDIKVKSLTGNGNITVVDYGDGETISISGSNDLTSTGDITFGTGDSLLTITDTGIEFGLLPTISGNAFSTGGLGGSTETASNIGAGTGLISGKVADDIKVKSLVSAGTISIAGGTNDDTVIISGARVGTGDLTSTGQVTFGTGEDLLFISDTGIHFGLVPTVNQSGMVLTGSVPASASAAGIPGQISFDASHLYIYVETSWKRVSIATW